MAPPRADHTPIMYIPEAENSHSYSEKVQTSGMGKEMLVSVNSKTLLEPDVLHAVLAY